MPRDNFEDNIAVEEVVAAPAPVAPAPVAKEAAAPAPAPAPVKLTQEQLIAPVAARAASIANRLPGIVNPQTKVDSDGTSAATARATSDVAKFLAARARRNG